jgi:endonuclease VIII
MPEGPEIKRAADQLAAVLNHQKAQLVEFAFQRLAPGAKRLTGERIIEVTPRGKAMLTKFENGETIYSHNQLYGEWRIYERIRNPRLHPSKQIRLVIHTQDHAAVLYSASDIAILPSANIHAHPYIAKLGVELLDAATTADDVLVQINSPRFAKKSLAALLLDQGFLAGLGNYLRSEILFVAQLPIDARLIDISASQRFALANAALALTRQSYETSGITNDIHLAASLKAKGWRFGRYRHWVFDREGESCHVCQTVIQRSDASGRGVYWCAKCQSR